MADPAPVVGLPETWSGAKVQRQANVRICCAGSMSAKVIYACKALMAACICENMSQIAS